MTTATKVTVLRIVLVPFFVVQVLYYERTGEEWHRLAAFVCFAVAALSAATSFAASKPDFAKDIGPLLAKNCLECHGAEKQKGKLRLDSKEAAFKGGDSGKAGIVPGKGADSRIYQVVTLPKGHDDIMPPKGEPLSKATTDLLKAWIDAGAEWPAGVKLTATGGAGGDVFVFEHQGRGAQRDVINDFKPGTDKIDLTDYGFANYAAVHANMVGDLGGVTISLGVSGDKLVLLGTTIVALDAHASDFLL